MVTLKDIAKECNVSFSTVSKALKGSREISDETTELVRQKARELGYNPNLAARTLRTNRTYDLGVIFEDQTGSGLQHQYFARIFSGLQQYAMKKGFEITFTGSNGKSDFDYYSHAKYRNFDGVAILSTSFTRPDIQALIQSDIPTVTLDYIADDNHTAVMSDNRAGMKSLLDYVLSRGHRKIAVIHGEDTLVTRDRLSMFTAMMNEHGITVPDDYVLQGLYHDPMTSQEATEILLSLPDPPTCIMYPDDFAALGGIRELNRRHLMPGKDISITGYDGIMLTSLLIPPLTTYEQSGESIGGLIAAHLINQIEDAAEYAPQHISVNGKLLYGKSVAVLS